MGEGRFGPLFRAHAEDDAPVMVRTFAQPFTAEQRERILVELAALCERPLDHPSIARPLAAGEQDGCPYLVHAYLPGAPAAEWLASAGPSVDDIILRLTYVAGALDFAAATGVLHGALSGVDVIFSTDNAGVSGFGLVQALEAAGVDGFHARRDDDIAALMTLARDLLGPRVARDTRTLLAAPPPASALEFVAALQRTIPPGPPDTPRFDFETDTAPVADPTLDFPLRRDEAPAGHRPPSVAAEPPADVEPRLRQPDPRPVSAPSVAADESMRTPVIDPRPQAVAGSAAFDVLRVSAPVADPAPRRRASGSWLVTAAVALALGVLAGFAGGFFVAGDTPPAVVTSPAPQAEPANGRAIGQAPVDRPAPPTNAPPAAADPSTGLAASPARDTAAPRPPSPSAGSSSRTRGATAGAARASGPAAMRVDSNPAGAQVFIDGRSVGYTPMVVGDLVPGTHSIRLQMPGYRPWVTAVTLGPGARERLAASLEQ